MAQEFLQGLQAARGQALGELQMVDAVETIKAKRNQAEKAQRIQNYLGQYQQPGADRAAIEGQVLGLAPDLSMKMREIRTEDEAKMMNQLGSLAAVASRAIGTPDEAQAMAWLGMEAEKIGVPRETIQETLTAYSQNPAQGRAAVQSLVARGMGAKDYLAQFETPKDIAEAERKTAGEIRLEGIKQKGRLELERIKAEGKAPTARQQKISDAMTDYNVSEKEARDIVDGRLKVQSDPLSGQTKLVNIATGTEKIVTGAPPVAEDAPAVEPPPEQTVFQSLDDAVGLVPGATEFIGQTFGQLAPELVEEDVVVARQKIRGLREKLIRALSLSGRPPVIEQQRLLDMLPSLGPLESPENARASLKALHGMLSRQVMDDMAVYNDPATPKKSRSEAFERARGIQSTLRELGAPPAESTTIDTQEEYDALPSGAEYIDKQSGQRSRKP